MRGSYKSRIIGSVIVIMLIFIGTEYRYYLSDKTTSDKEAEEVNVETDENLVSEIKSTGYNAIEDYKKAINGGVVTQFVSPKYNISIDSKGNCTLNSEENAVYFTDSANNTSVVSIQYETDDSGVERQFIYGIKTDGEDDLRAIDKFKEIFVKFEAEENMYILEKAFNGAVAEFNGQSGSYGFRRNGEESSLKVGVTKKLLGNRYSYQMSISYHWENLKSLTYERVKELESTIDIEKVSDSFNFGLKNVFEFDTLAMIDTKILTENLSDILDVSSKYQSVELDFNEQGLAWISITSVLNDSKGRNVQVACQVVKTANDIIKAYTNIRATNNINIADVASRVVVGIQNKYPKEFRDAIKIDSEHYVELKNSPNNSSIAYNKKSDYSTFDLSQAYSIVQ